MKIKKFDSINMVPLVDVMLVIIVILLSVATFAPQSTTFVDLPQGTTAQKTKPRAIKITIDKANQIYLDAKPIDMKSLGIELDKKAPRTPIEIYCDSGARYEGFAKLLLLLKEKELSDISIVTADQ